MVVFVREGRPTPAWANFCLTSPPKVRRVAVVEEGRERERGKGAHPQIDMNKQMRLLTYLFI